MKTEQDSDYCIKIMNGVKLFGRSIRINKSSGEQQKNADIGCNLFVGNLSNKTDEKLLRDVFSAFGIVVQTKVMRDENG